MPVGPWVLIGIGILVLLVVAVLQASRRRRRRIALVINLRDVVIKPVAGHAAWYVDLRAEFDNAGDVPVSITAVRAVATRPGEADLEAKRVLGDEFLRDYDIVHPADIAMRLPILRQPGKRVGYRFHIFFSAHLHRLWQGGLIDIYATTPDGVTAKGECALAAPSGPDAGA